MRARLTPVLNKLASLLWHFGEAPLYCIWIAKERWPKQTGWAWAMAHQLEWQKSSGFNLLLLPVSFVSLRYATHHYGDSLTVVLVQTAAYDSVTWGFNKTEAFRNRGASKGASGGRSVFISAFCMLYHKALAFLLLAVFGMGAMEIKAALTAVGAVENPVLFVVRDKWIFTKAGLWESFRIHWRIDSARTAAIGNWARMKTGV